MAAILEAMGMARVPTPRSLSSALGYSMGMVAEGGRDLPGTLDPILEGRPPWQ